MTVVHAIIGGFEGIHRLASVRRCGQFRPFSSPRGGGAWNNHFICCGSAFIAAHFGICVAESDGSSGSRWTPVPSRGSSDVTILRINGSGLPAALSNGHGYRRDARDIRGGIPPRPCGSPPETGGCFAGFVTLYPLGFGRDG
jgi:hypothetical protein